MQEQQAWTIAIGDKGDFDFSHPVNQLSRHVSPASRCDFRFRPDHLRQNHGDCQVLSGIDSGRSRASPPRRKTLIWLEIYMTEPGTEPRSIPFQRISARGHAWVKSKIPGTAGRRDFLDQKTEAV
jgi:hypothetical protein